MGSEMCIRDRVEAYERDRYDLPAPDPIAALEYFMESRGWTRKQLEPYIGSRGRVSEVLSRKRSLTLPMIRRLEQATGIPGSILIQPYPTEQDYPGLMRRSHVCIGSHVRASK